MVSAYLLNVTYFRAKQHLLKVCTALVLAILPGCGTTRGGNQPFEVTRGVVYKSVEGKMLKGDIFRPADTGPKPGVVVVHGGSWASRSGDMEGIAERLAREGFVAFNITYRLAPESLYPKAVEDVRDAIKWLHENAAKYGVDKKKISGWGYSAGAHLILLVGLDARTGLQAIVAGGTPAYFPAWPHSPIIKKFIGKSLKEAPELWREASPALHVKKDSPPVFLYHGYGDTLVEADQMYRMRDALVAAHRPVETYEVPILGHIGVYLFSRKSEDLGVDFLKKH